MSGITLAQAEARLAAYLAAEERILAGQRVSLDGKDLTRADLATVHAGIRAWERRIARLSAGGAARITYGVPR